MAKPKTKKIPEAFVNGKRLGRHIDLEAHRLAKPYSGPAKAIVSVMWARSVACPILDQGNLGSCTGNAMVGALGTDPVYGKLPVNHPVLDEFEAVHIYSDATAIDPFAGTYPPDDTGSNGESVAKVAKSHGYISDYHYYVDLNSMLQALMTGPVIVGINWYSSFDSPAADGLVAITSGAYVRGGHEVLVRGVDITKSMLFLDNSWGAGWGSAGSFKFSYATMTRLFNEEADCVEPIPLDTVIPDPTPFPAPTGVAFGGVDHTASIKWNAVTGANGYRIQAVGLNKVVYVNAASATNSVVLHNLHVGWTYDVKVSALGGVGTPGVATLRIAV